MGRPVVASAAAAVGIAVRRGEDIQVADLPSDFAEAVLGLLEPVRAEQMGQQARRAVLVNYDWETNLAAFKLLLTGNLPRSPAVRDIGESERASEAA
jgi:glycosyltransferase involved in cell wall biosynthesis